MLVQLLVRFYQTSTETSVLVKSHYKNLFNMQHVGKAIEGVMQVGGRSKQHAASLPLSREFDAQRNGGLAPCGGSVRGSTGRIVQR